MKTDTPYYLKKQAFRYRAISRVGRFGLGLAVFGIVVFFFVLTLNLLNVHKPVLSYMLFTGPDEFDRSEFTNIVEKDFGNTDLLPLFIAVYKTPYLAVIGFVIILFSKVLLRLFIRNLARAWLLVRKLREDIQMYFESPSRLNRFRIVRRVNQLNLYETISPIHHKWYRLPAYQWLKTEALDRKERSVVLALSRFDSTLMDAIDKGYNLSAFQEPLKILEEFFLSISNRYNFKNKKRSSSPRSITHERNVLQDFAKTFIALAVAVNSAHEPDKKPSRIVQSAYQVINSPLVRKALMVSLIAAIVMLIGVFTFEIKANQAFLTWFTVTFGSLTLSIGITYVRISTNGKEESR